SSLLFSRFRMEGKMVTRTKHRGVWVIMNFHSPPSTLICVYTTPAQRTTRFCTIPHQRTFIFPLILFGDVHAQ
ncbi:hypothetical protein D0Y65_020366, partial [Glycine soja]